MPLRLTPGPVLLASTGPNAWLSLVPGPGGGVDDGSARAFVNVTLGGDAVSSTATADISASAAVTLAGDSVSSTGTVADAVDEVTVVFPDVTVAAATDLAPSYQGLGGHTLHGAGIPFADDAYWWVTVDGVGADPGLAGMTGYEIALTGAGPFTGADVATAAVTAASGSGYTLDRTDDTIVVSGGGLDAAATVTAANSRTGYTSRGGGGLIGATQIGAGSSTNAGSTGWIQVDPALVPSGAFRVVGFELQRGANISTGVRMCVGSGGTADGDPEGAVVDHQRTMGNSGANTVHREWLAHDEVVEYSGGERLWMATHGDGGGGGQIVGGSGVNDGLFASGSTTLWLTDGTTGSTTPIVSPAGAVTSSFNFGTVARLIIEEAPYQTDGDYRAIGGAIEGVHDGDLFAGGTELEDIFVAWGLALPNIQGIQLKETRVRFQSHGGAGDTKRFELWNALGGATTFVGDTLISLLGQTTASTPSGWSSLGHAPISLTPGADIRISIKGEVSTGTAFDFDLGGPGIGDVGHPVYSLSGGALEDDEIEVLGTNPDGVDETALDFDPSVATASPNNANGDIEFPGNVGMWSLHLGPAAPTVTDTTS